jgi:hypothetical protein
MALTLVLDSTSISEWRTRQAIVFDWCDGPRQGICALAHPPCEFLFEIVDEKSNADGLDDRLFRLSELPIGSIDNALEALSVIRPKSPSRVWAPIWKFPDAMTQQQAEETLEKITAARQETSAVISSSDMLKFQGYWNSDKVGMHPENWHLSRNMPVAVSNGRANGGVETALDVRHDSPSD